MTRLEQIIKIEPANELKFRGPFNMPVTSYMKLTNPTDKRVIFKIKTTAPKKYCVRPNAGILEPKNVVEIAICLQPFIFDPNEKNKHKFMVQTVIAPEGEINQETLWKEVNPEELMDSKLKCVFELPPSEGVTVADNQNNDNIDIQNETKIPDDILNKSPGFNTTVSDSRFDELEQLRKTGELLQRENLQLKEEVLRLRQYSGGAVSSKYSPQAAVAQQPFMTPLHIVVGVFVVIVGIVLGKFVL